MPVSLTKMDNTGFAKIAEKFVEEKKGIWNHDEWLSFLDLVRKEGYPDNEYVLGELLEEERKRYLKKNKIDTKDDAYIIDIFAQGKKAYSKLNSLWQSKSEKKDERKIGSVESALFESEKPNQAAIKEELLETKKELESNRKEPQDFMKTGIEGFDSLLTKGIPRGVTILLSGGPGCGKTTFGLHMLAKSAEKKERCLYMSFEEKEEQLISHMENFGFSPRKDIADGNLMIKRYDPFMISQNVEALLAEARGELLIKLDKIEQFIPKGFKPEIIVLDSLSAVSAAFAGRKDGYRIYIEQLFRSLEKTGATSFLITETSANLKTYESKVEEFLADGVISFYNIRKGNSRVKALEIIKIRGVNFKKKIVPFDILEGTGIEVYPMEEVFTRKI